MLWGKSMSEFGAAATLSIVVPDSEVQAARAKLESGLEETQINLDTSGADFGSRGGGTPSLADGGTAMSSMMAAQTELLEDIEDHLASGIDSGGGGGIGAGSAGALGLAVRGGSLGSLGTIGSAVGAAALPFAAQGAAATAIPGSAESLGNRYSALMDGNIGEKIAANFANVFDPLGIGQTIARGAGEAIASGDIGSSIGGAFQTAVDPLGFGQDIGSQALGELTRWDPALPDPELDIPSPPAWITSLLDFVGGAASTADGGSGTAGSNNTGGHESQIPTGKNAQTGSAEGPLDTPPGGIRLEKNGGMRGFRTQESAREQLTRRDQGGNRARKRSGQNTNVTVDQDVSIAPSSLKELEREMDRFKEDVIREVEKELINNITSGGVL
jgi:hypothetical protein